MATPATPGREVTPTNPLAPSDASGRFGLLHLVNDAIRSVDWPHKESAFSLGPDQSFASTQLMALEVYSYARGIYGSAEVSSLTRIDPALRGLFPGDTPADTTIRKFRRQHREPILQCLLHIFSRAFLVRFGEPNTDPMPVDYCVAVALDRWFEPICGPRPDSEAAERIDRAIFWDGMAAADK